MYRILHFSDLHLDASFARCGMTPSVARQRRDELRTGLKNILRKATELGVNAITIGGDLYEHDRASNDTMNFLRGQFETIAPLPILITPGNHDPLLPGSPYRLTNWPANVFIFSANELTPRPLDRGITLWGAAHNSPSFRTNLFEHFRASGDGMHLALLHASDITCVPSGKAAHCPFSPDQITRAGISFALLGHYHRASLFPEKEPLYGYPGSPEPLGFDEDGAHHVLLVDIDGNRVTQRLIPINTVDYRTIEVDASEASSVEDIKQSVTSKIAREHLGKSLVKVLLKGTLNPDVTIDLQSIVDDCHEACRFIEVENHTIPPYDLDTLKDERTVRGAFVRKMIGYLEGCSAEEKRIAEQALIFGLRALDNRGIELP